MKIKIGEKIIEGDLYEDEKCPNDVLYYIPHNCLEIIKNKKKTKEVR